MSDTACHTNFGLGKVSCGVAFQILFFLDHPIHGTRTHFLTPETSAQHGPARYDDGGQIYAASAHDRTWCSLVAAGQKYDPIQGVRPNGFLDIHTCLLYTSPSPRDGLLSRMPSSA